MKLKFVSKPENSSIDEFDEVTDMPEFSILTGLNGSGKTHLLKAIRTGNVQIDDLAAADTAYYSYLDFRITNSASPNEGQLRSQRDEAWNSLSKTPGRPRIQPKAMAEEIYKQQIRTRDADEQNGIDIAELESAIANGEINIWRELPPDLDEVTRRAILSYRAEVEQKIFRSQGYRSTGRNQSTTKECLIYSSSRR